MDVQDVDAKSQKYALYGEQCEDFELWGGVMMEQSRITKSLILPNCLFSWIEWTNEGYEVCMGFGFYFIFFRVDWIEMMMSLEILWHANKM